MAKSLLQQAMAVKAPPKSMGKTNKSFHERLTLALAFHRGEVSSYQVAKAINQSPAAIPSRMAGILASGVKRGFIKTVDMRGKKTQG